MLKSVGCGSLRLEHAGQTVSLAGWVHRRRDHGGLVFIDLRDSTGLIQVVFHPEEAPDAFNVAERFRAEWVAQITGTVRPRPEGTANSNLDTGDVEVMASAAVVLNPSRTPPFDVSQDAPVDELLRMRYRYLDLRRPFMRENLRMRHRVVKFIRDYLDERGFVEIETPILIKSTPEGARDFLVPSRIHQGSFYALPQSPQQLKQLLMVAGTDRYFQIARCFRDEDPRADRLPEFTQLDLEMAFVDRDDIVALMTDLYTDLIQTIRPDKRVPLPVPHFTFNEAMARFGSDKPDIRFGLEIADFSPIVAGSEFKVFSGVVANGGVVKGFAAPGLASIPRRQADELIELAKRYGARGLVTIALDEAAGSLDALTLKTTYARLPARWHSTRSSPWQPPAARCPATSSSSWPEKSRGPPPPSASLRLHMGERLGLADPNTIALCVITDFPLFDWNENEQRWDSVHHPFTSPFEDQWERLETDPGNVLSRAYDLAANGYELAGGSIRIHERARQEDHLPDPWPLRRERGGAVRSPAGSLRVRRSPARRLRGRHRPADHDPVRHRRVHPRHHRLSRRPRSALDPLFGAPSPVDQYQLDQLGLALAPRSPDPEKQ